MAIQTVFCVTGFEVDLSMKQVIIETNFKVDISSATPDNIKLYIINKEDIQIVIPYKIQVENKNIILKLENYPNPNDKYYIVVKDVQDVLSRPLHNIYERTFYFEDDVTSKVNIILPTSQFTSKTENLELKIAISDENEETKYRFEISSDMAFFNKETIVFKNNRHDPYVSDSSKLEIIGAIRDGNEIHLLVKIKNDGQYFLRVRAEKTHYVVGDWSDIVDFNVVTTEPIKSESGYLDDFLLPDEIFKEEIKELKILSKTPSASTSQDFYIEFNKDIKFEENLESKYSKEGLLYIGKATMIRRDL